jgi:hypothetical protein
LANDDVFRDLDAVVVRITESARVAAAAGGK